MRQFNRLDNVHSWVDVSQCPPPNEPGVYFIYASGVSCFGPWCELLYVGSTSNLKRRLSSHKIIREHKSTKLRITYSYAHDYSALEKEAIKRFAPLANIHHNSPNEG